MRPKYVSRDSVSLLGFLILAAGPAARAHLVPVQGSPPIAQAGPLRLEDGTAIKIRLSQTISSATSQTNDRVDFEVLEEVKAGSLVVIPKGSIAWGTITEAQAKRRMARGGKLDVNIDSVRLADGEKAALRGVKDVKGGGHTGAMTGAIVATSLVMWPAAPFFLLMHGKDITIPQGTELTVYVNGDFAIDPGKFGGPPPTTHPVEPLPTGAAPTIVLVDPSGVNSGETLDLTTSILTIRGVVTDPSGIPAVTINGTAVSMLPKGPQAAEFSSDAIKLNVGENRFEIVATNAARVQARITFMARYSPSDVPPPPTVTRTNGRALTKGEILSLLNGEVPSARVTNLVEERGISFVPTDNDFKDIRAAGGGDDLVNALMESKNSQ